MGKGGGGSTNTVQKADPWAGVQPYLSQLYGSASNYFTNGGPQYYPNQTVAQYGPATQQAQQMGTQLATNGQPNVNAAQAQNLSTVNGAGLNSNPANPYFQQLAGGSAFANNPSNAYFQNTANGAFLNSNPYLDQMYRSATTPMVQQYQNAIAPGLMSQFSAAGRTGSGANLQALQSAQQPLAQGLAQAASSIYGGNYANERALQQQAAQGLGANYMGGANLGLQGAQGLGGNYNFASGQQQNAINSAIPLGQQSWSNISNLSGIGQQQQQIGQQFLNSDIARYDYGQNQPMANMQNYNAILNGATPYRSSSTNQSVSANPLSQAIGTGLAASSIYNTGANAGLWGSGAMTGADLASLVGGYGGFATLGGAAAADGMGAAALLL